MSYLSSLQIFLCIFSGWFNLRVKLFLSKTDSFLYPGKSEFLIDKTIHFQLWHGSILHHNRTTLKTDKTSFWNVLNSSLEKGDTVGSIHTRTILLGQIRWSIRYVCLDAVTKLTQICIALADTRDFENYLKYLVPTV